MPLAYSLQNSLSLVKSQGLYTKTAPRHQRYREAAIPPQIVKSTSSMPYQSALSKEKALTRANI